MFLITPKTLMKMVSLMLYRKKNPNHISNIQLKKIKILRTIFHGDIYYALFIYKTKFYYAILINGNIFVHKHIYKSINENNIKDVYDFKNHFLIRDFIKI